MVMISKKNRDYWKKRFEILEERQMNKGINYYHELEKQYRIAALEIEKEISTWYQRFADNNGIVNMYEAKKLLNSRQLEELRWNVDEYIKYGKENAINSKWIKQLENASGKVHINRLEALKLQCQQQVEALYGNELDGVDRLLKNIYTKGFYHTGFEIAKGTGIGTTFAELDTNRIEKVMSKPWTTDGTNFSKRIWGNHRPELINKIHTKLTQNIINGKPQDKTIQEISKAFNVSKAKAGRLVMTESAFFASAGQKDCFNDLNIEFYEVVSTLDLKTCTDCGSLDGKPIPMKDYEVGTTAPPFHPFCRCTTAPYFNDEFTENDLRASRDEDGNTVYVASDMNYDEWKKKFVKSIDNPKFIKIKNDINANADILNIISGELNLVPKSHRDILKAYVNEIQLTNSGNSCYHRENKIVYININNLEKGEIIHELGHAIETKLDLYHNDKFLEVLNSGLENVVLSDLKLDTESFNIDVELLENPKFISKYQGLMYEYDIDRIERIDYNSWKVNMKTLGEYFSEGYREYLINPINLKNHDKKLYNFIKGLI